MCLSHKSKEKRFEKCEVLRVEHRSENPIQYFLSGEAGRGIFAFLSKQGYVYERIPAFLLSNILILKIVQTLVFIRILNFSVESGISAFNGWYAFQDGNPNYHGWECI